jgi:SAM-dependent methyltransferase
MAGNFTLDELKGGIPELLTDDSAIRVSVWEELKHRDLSPMDLFWAIESKLFKEFVLGRNLSFEDFYTDKSISYLVLADIISTQLREASSVMEAGCGGSMSLPYLTKRGFQTTGLDKSKAALKYLSELSMAAGIEVRLVEKDFLDSQFPPDTFDFVFNVGVMEHFDREQQRDFLRKMLYISRFGVLIAVPNKDCPVRSTILLDYASLPSGLAYPDECYPVNLCDLSREAGAKIVERGGYNIVPSKIDPRFLDADGIDFYTKRLPRIKFGGDIHAYIRKWAEVEKSVDVRDKIRYGWYHYTIMTKNGG